MLDVGRRTGPGAIEIDDVQRASAGADPAQRRVERVGVVSRPLVELAAPEPHGAAVEDVDRRIEDHARVLARPPVARAAPSHSPTKLRSSASPWIEDFSG